MQQPRFEMHQLRQLVGIPRIILGVALVDVRHFARVRYVDFMPALFDHLRHPPRLSAASHRHTAPWNASEVLPESFLFHPQPELPAHFAVRIQNADIAVFVAQIDSDVEGQALFGFLLALVHHLLLAGILLHSRSPFCTFECVSNWELNASRRETGPLILSLRLCVEIFTSSSPDSTTVSTAPSRRTGNNSAPRIDAGRRRTPGSIPCRSR